MMLSRILSHLLYNLIDNFTASSQTVRVWIDIIRKQKWQPKGENEPTISIELAAKGGEREPFSFFVSIWLSKRGKSCGKDNKDYESLTADYGVYKYI